MGYVVEDRAGKGRVRRRRIGDERGWVAAKMLCETTSRHGLQRALCSVYALISRAVEVQTNNLIT
jgi:hypothetical protein